MPDDKVVQQIYRKKVCMWCKLIIHAAEDQESIRPLTGSVEYYHVGCLAKYEAEIRAEKKQKAKGGRPAAITPAVKTKLDEAFGANCNKIEACLHAGICRKTLERYIEANPKYSNRIEQLRANPRRLAKMNQAKEVQAGNPSTSEFILKHTDDEYNPKQKQSLELTGNKDLIDAIITSKAEREKK